MAFVTVDSRIIPSSFVSVPNKSEEIYAGKDTCRDGRNQTKVNVDRDATGGKILVWPVLSSCAILGQRQKTDRTRVHFFHIHIRNRQQQENYAKSEITLPASSVSKAWEMGSSNFTATRG